jgi:hypothetical protein
MLKQLTIAALAVALSLSTVGTAQAAGTATVYIIHGIRGQDLGLDPRLPVDVSVNGACTLRNFTFGRQAGPLRLAAGTYAIAISLANSDKPCSNQAVIAADVPFAAGENATVIAHVDAAGAPTASKFVNDLSAIERGQSRVIVRHAAAAPTVDVRLTRGSSSATLEDLSNGGELKADIRRGLYRVSLLAANTETVAFGPRPIFVFPRIVTVYYAVGSLETGSLTLLTQYLFVH